ncbi:MAG: ERF family protein [Paludibacteraceae bacterium]|nr:ERF family protein [Paludibacteraceae bacterium]
MSEEKATKTTETAKLLTLQQKFVKLREAIPSITQKQHSDGVKYKFAKIFDIYELLTPAMNEYGVNFDVVEESATRHAENGDDLYYHSYQQQTKNGPRTVWVYEADLTLRWTNADDPEDTQEVTLHAIGTNDGGPDKAKGSAWTYCLKYYLFEKFGIDQGDDDPDNTDLTAPLSDTQKAPSNASNNKGGEITPQQGKNAPKSTTEAKKGISDAQLDRMYKKGADAGFTQEQIDERINAKYGLTNPRSMTREQYDETCAALDKVKTTNTTEGGNSNA